MTHKMGVTTRVLIGLMLAVFASTALAIMPPAPPEWYQRLNLPMPEGLKSARADLPHDIIEKDLAKAAERQPNNTDNILLILVEFPDNNADQINHPQSAYYDMMFSTGVVPTGSLLEYYQEISYGTFAPEGSVTMWIMAPHPYTYYADGAYGMGSYPQNSQGLLADCVDILDPSIDFSEFDNNNDGYVEGIFLVHAGPGGEETGDPNTIWSHAWYKEVPTDDGVSTGRYSIEPEEHLDGSLIAIGVYCHEYGHVLGMPDLYDYDGSSEGVGVYCLMAGGSWGALPGNPERPTHMSAEMKRRLNWMTPIEVTGNLADLVIPPAATSPVCYQVFHPTDAIQYYLIENRAKIGFDSLFRGDGGLAIWHVELYQNQNDENHPYVSLEQADGNYDLKRDYGGGNRDPRTNRGDAGDLYPGAAGNTYFSFSSNPNSYDYDLLDAFVTLDQIEYYGDSIIVDIYVSPDAPIYRFSSVEVFDTTSSGPMPDMDGEADDGEVVDVVVSLACDGESASSISGTIQTTDSRVAIGTGTASFAPVSHNEYTDNSSSPFRITVNDPGSDSAVTFDLQMTADGDIYDLQFKLNINRQKILVVLDNNGSHWSGNLIDAMHNSGYSFDIYNIVESGTPQIDDLIPYHAVLWTTASYFGNRTSTPDYEDCLTIAETDVLAEYLDNNGRVGLFSQDYMYDRGVDAFASNYMYITNFTPDMGCTHISGLAGTFADGYDGYAAEWSFYDYTDYLTPRSGGEAVMRDDLSTRTVMVNHPSTPVAGAPATTFSSFAIEHLDVADLEAFLAAWCDWILTDMNIDVPIPIYPVEGDSAIPTPEFRWSASDGAASYNIEVATDFEFTNIIRDSSVMVNTAVFGDDLADGTYYWRVKASPDTKAPTPYSPRANFVVYDPIVYVCGDANNDGETNVGDAVHIINFVFKGGPAPDPLCQGDANGDGDVNVGDAVYLISYVFKGGPAPVEPCCP